MTMEGEAGAHLAASSSGAAQQWQQPSQPDEASTDAASQPPAVITALLRDLLTSEQIQTSLVSSFITEVAVIHNWARLWDETDTLYQQLATRLHFGCRCAKSSAIVGRLTEEVPVDACSGSSSRALFQAVVKPLIDHADIATNKAKVDLWRLIVLLDPAQPEISAILPSLQDSLQHVAAGGNASSKTRDPHETRQLALESAGRHGEVRRRAQAIIRHLDAQGVVDLSALEKSVDALMQAFNILHRRVPAAGDSKTVVAEGLQEEGVRPACNNSGSKIISSGTEGVQPVDKAACSGSTAGQDKVAQASAESAGVAAQPAAQLAKTGADGTCTLNSAVKARSAGQPAEAVQQILPPLTWEDVQQLLDIHGVTTAAAALVATQKEAEQVVAQCKWTLKYLQIARACLPSCCNDADWEADMLYRRARAWAAALEDMLENLAWAAGTTQEQLNNIREAWEGRMQTFLTGDAKVMQALAEELCTVVKGYAAGIRSMQGCFEAMQTRYASLLRSARAYQQAAAATAYALISLVRNGSVPVELRPASCRSTCHPASDGAAQDTRASPAPQSAPAADLDSDGSSESPAAMPSAQLFAGVRQTAEGQAASESSSGTIGVSDDRWDQCARREGGLEAWQATRAEWFQQWHAHMDAREPVDAAHAAAALRSAELWAATEERMRAARLRSYPLPRRVTLPYMEATVQALVRSVRAKRVAGDRLRKNGLAGTLAEVGRLQGRCESQIKGAHWNGLVWVAGLAGPDFAGGKAWYSEFLEACAGVHGARVLAEGHLEGALRRVDSIDAAMNGLWSQLEGAAATVLTFKSNIAERSAINQEEAACVMQNALRVEAAVSTYMADRTAALKEAKDEAERVLARLQKENARTQALELRTAEAWAGATSRLEKTLEEDNAARRAQKKAAKKARRRQAEAAAACAGAPVVDAASAAGGSALQRESRPEAVADASEPLLEELQKLKQCDPAAGGLGASADSLPSKVMQPEGDPVRPASATEEQRCAHKDHHGVGVAWNTQAAGVASEQPAAASSNLEAVLSLLLPGLAAAAGPKDKDSVDTGSPPEELAAPPASMLASACASAASWPDCSPAAQSAKVLRQGSPAAAAPEEQRERLRAFVRGQIWPADTTGGSDAPWPEVPACEARVTDSGLCEGGLAEGLFRRMGSTPAAAALLHSLVCPITKDFARDAVVAADGCTYEREAIEGWMQHSSRSCRRKQRLRSTHLFHNRLYNAIVGMLAAF